MSRTGFTPTGWLRPSDPVLAALGIFVALGCSGATDPNPGPKTGSIRVAVASSGEDVDGNGYAIEIDGVVRAAISANASITLNNLSPRTYAVGLGSCGPTSANPVSVDVTAGVTVEATFAVACVPLVGSVEVTVATTGEVLDDDGYVVTVIDGPSAPAEVNGVVTLSDVDVGNRSVELSNMAANCQVTGANPVVVTVVYGQTTPVAFNVSCFAPPPGTIAFLSERDGIWPAEVFVMNGAGGEVTRVTYMPEEKRDDVGARISPDGTKILFNAANDLWVINRDGTGLRNLTVTPDTIEENPRWSPDGSQVASSRSNPPCTTVDVCSMWTVNADGTGLNRLAQGAPAGFNGLICDWSPDGSQIVLTAWNPWNVEYSDLYLVNSDGTGLQQLTHGDQVDGRYSWCGVWSPDGTRILFSGEDPGIINYLNVIEADGTGQTTLVGDDFRGGSAWYAGGAWSPDGAIIAYACSPGLCVIHADGSGRQTIDSALDWYGRMLWAPDGSVLGFTGSQEGQQDVYTIRPDGTSLRNLTNRVTRDAFGSWTQ